MCLIPQKRGPSVSRPALGWGLIVLGLVVLIYAFMHDKFWNLHDGYILMGLKSYSVALLGVVLVLIGGVFRGSGR